MHTMNKMQMLAENTLRNLNFMQNIASQWKHSKANVDMTGAKGIFAVGLSVDWMESKASRTAAGCRNLSARSPIWVRLLTMEEAVLEMRSDSITRLWKGRSWSNLWVTWGRCSTNRLSKIWNRWRQWPDSVQHTLGKGEPDSYQFRGL